MLNRTWTFFLTGAFIDALGLTGVMGLWPGIMGIGEQGGPCG